MAVVTATLLHTHSVSDLCIGKPALRWLPPSSTVADAITDLEAAGSSHAAVAVWDGAEGSDVAGRVCMADVLLFLCADTNLASPSAALQATFADLLAAGTPPVRRIEPHASVVDAFLDGAHSLVVPIRDRDRQRCSAAAAGGGRELCMCWLTVEDVVRFFLSSIALFSATASRSVSELGVVRPASLAVDAGDNALSCVPLLRAALASHGAVALVSGALPRHLAGEISPSSLCSCDVSASAAIAALSADDLMSFIHWGSAVPEGAVHAVRSRLRRRNLHGMVDLLYDGSDPSWSSSSSSSTSSSSSSDDDDEVGGGKRRIASPSPRAGAGRRAGEEVTTGCRCHRGSSLVAVMVQATSHRATQVWVVEEERDLWASCACWM